MAMKKQLVLSAALLCAAFAAEAQDMIVKRNAQAEEIPAKVIEVGENQIRYRKFSNPDGPIYTISRSEVFFIRYENGEKEVITAYAAPAAAPQAQTSTSDLSGALLRSGKALREYKPLRDRSWEVGITPTVGYALVFFEQDSWSGPAISFSVDGNYYFSKYSTACVGASLEFLYSALGTDDISGDCSIMNLDLYYGTFGSPAGSSFGGKVGISLGFPMSLQMGDYDMSESLNGFQFGTFTQLGWSWAHNDLGLRLQYNFSNLIKEVDSSLFRFGVYYSHRF